MTVGELKQGLAGLPGAAEVTVYVDLSGPVVRPFADLEERVNLCGYYALAAVERLPDGVVLVVGSPLNV